MTTMPIETYGEGGFDPAKPDRNVVDTQQVPIPVTEQNRVSLSTKATTALAANATFLALPAPSAAQVSAQTKMLTRECSALIRLLLNQLDDISGT